MKSFISFVTERLVGLSQSELQKPNSKTGQARIDILLSVINSEEFIYSVDELKFKILNTDENISAVYNLKSGIKAVSFNCVDHNGTSFSLSSNKIAKSFVFGGSFTGDAKNQGMSAAETTAIGEAAQCYFNSIAGNLLKRKITAEDITLENFKDSERWVFADRTPEKIIENLSQTWLDSGITIANKLLTSGYLAAGNKYHRGSKFMSLLYKSAAKALKSSNKKLANDKWNPGDIWIESLGSSISDFDTSSIAAFNDNMLTHFDDKTLVGVSLKLAKASAKIETFNRGAPPPPYNVDKFLLRGTGKTSKFFKNTKSSIVLTNGTTFEGRAFQYMTNFAFEILGKNARGGKIGFNIIADLANTNGIKINKNITKLSKSIFTSKKLDLKFIKEWWVLYSNVTSESTVDLEEFTSFMQTKFDSGNKNDLNWMWSKYIGTYMIDKIKSAGKPRHDMLVTDMINHAKSATSSSSVFIKIY